MRSALAILALLAACGGGTVAVVIATPPQPRASEPAASAPAVPAPAASAPASAPEVIATQWRTSWAGAWTVGGTIVQPVITCPASGADPESLEGRAQPGTAADWMTFGDAAHALAGIAGVTDGRLMLDSLQTRELGGWALLSAARWAPDRPLRLETVIDLTEGWISAPLIAGEGDYRQLSLRVVEGGVRAELGAPCHWQLLQTYPPGPRALALEYTPAADICWRYYVDGALLAEERCDHLGAPLTGPARAGLYVVSTDVERGRLTSGRVRAVVGPITVMEQ